MTEDTMDITNNPINNPNNEDVTNNSPTNTPEGFIERLGCFLLSLIVHPWRKIKAISSKNQLSAISQFFVILHVTFDTLLVDMDPDTIHSKQKIIDKIGKLFAEFDDQFIRFRWYRCKALFKRRDTWIRHAWRIAYQIELYLIELYPEKNLAMELERRMEKAQTHSDKIAVEFYRKAVYEANDGQTKKALLKNIIDDMQWMYTNREEMNEYRRLIRIRTSLLFSFVTALLVAVIFVLQSKTEITFTALITLTGVVGFWGASFSMLLSLQKDLREGSLEDVKTLNSLWVLTFRGIIGAGAAMVLAFMALANLLPQILPDTLQLLKVSTETISGLNTIQGKDLFLNEKIHQLIIWCFLAGFSEKLVPSVLGDMEKKS